MPRISDPISEMYKNKMVKDIKSSWYPEELQLMEKNPYLIAKGIRKRKSKGVTELRVK